MEAALRALSPTSMPKMNLVSLWSTANPLLHVGAVRLLEAGHRGVVAQHTIVGVRDRVDLSGEASSREVEVNGEVQGRDGEIGTRCPSSFYSVLSRLTFGSLRQGSRARESSVAISPSWPMLEEIEMLRLSKLRMEVDEPEDL